LGAPPEQNSEVLADLHIGSSARGIFMKTERSEGDHQLPGFVDLTSADHGVFLYPQRDIYFYIPWDSIEPAEAIPKVRELLVSRAKIKG
jgi:hypothetical protein